MRYRVLIQGTHAQCHAIWNNLIPQFYRDDNRCFRDERDSVPTIEINSDTSGAIGRYSVQPHRKGYPVPVVSAAEILRGL